MRKKIYSFGVMCCLVAGMGPAGVSGQSATKTGLDSNFSEVEMPFLVLPTPTNKRPETSGLAASTRTPDLLWCHEDRPDHHDNRPNGIIYALRPDGTEVGRILPKGVEIYDPEDLAAFVFEGKSWLCLADVGNNDDRDRKEAYARLHFFVEPAIDGLQPGKTIEITNVFSMKVTYDGRKDKKNVPDCEAVAVDGREKAIYLITKDVPCVLYRIDSTKFNGEATAISMGKIESIKPNDYRNKGATAFDFSADGTAAVVLTYTNILLFEKGTNQSWANALRATPKVTQHRGMPQTESACFSSNGDAVYISSEKTRTLRRYPRLR